MRSQQLQEAILRSQRHLVLCEFLCDFTTHPVLPQAGPPGTTQCGIHTSTYDLKKSCEISVGQINSNCSFRFSNFLQSVNCYNSRSVIKRAKKKLIKTEFMLSF